MQKSTKTAIGTASDAVVGLRRFLACEPNLSRTRSSRISYAGRVDRVRAPSVSNKFFTTTGAPKVRASMSSVTTAYAWPRRHNAAHVASASPGASTTATPMSLNSVLTSWLCCRVTRVVADAARYTSSRAASAGRASYLTCASRFRSDRSRSVASLSRGDGPSNTKIGLTPASSSLSTRFAKPWMCDLRTVRVSWRREERGFFETLR
mmetsp:Transcript_4696/g.19142  ORF Transcript_4696/g.19142 Transcript_4696/m.19142 type:complete len:207 (+) Transcript_4696:1134-1754(+)